MNRYSAPLCALDIPEETLSAWHDGLLNEREAQRLASHLSSCAACQSRLANIQSLGQTLRQQWSPNLQARVWRGLRHAMEGDHMKGRSGAIWGTTAAVVAAVLVVALFAGLLLRRAGQNSLPGGNTTLTPTPAATSTPTPTPTPTSTAGGGLDIPAGWTAAQGIGQGTIPSIAIAPSDPQIAYACLVSANSDLIISGSQDAGVTWHVLTPPPRKQQQSPLCVLSVNPTDPRDVLLAGSDSFSTHLLRTRDGGQTWQPQPVQWAFQAMGWAGSTAYVTTTLTESAVAQTSLYRSVGGAPFTQLDSDGKVSGISLADQGQAHLITGSGSTAIIQFGVPQQPDTLRSISSADGGATWKTATYSASGVAIQPVAATGDGRVLAGLAPSAPDRTALSRDGGATWQTLPARPAALPAVNDLWVCPDGSVFAISTTFDQVDGADSHLYRLAPGAAAWTVALTMPESAFVSAFACDAGGHPTMVWASYAYTGTGSWALIAHPLAP